MGDQKGTMPLLHMTLRSVVCHMLGRRYCENRDVIARSWFRQ